MTVTCQAPAGQLPGTCQASSVESLFSSRFGALGPHLSIVFSSNFWNNKCILPPFILSPFHRFRWEGLFSVMPRKSSVQQVEIRQTCSTTFSRAFSKDVGSGLVAKMLSGCSRLSNFPWCRRSLERDFVRSGFCFFNHIMTDETLDLPFCLIWMHCLTS